LRVETTINNPGAFQSYRSSEGDPEGPKSWRPMRKGVADMHRRAEVSRQSNDRYADTLASLDTSTPIGQLAARLYPSQSAGQTERGRIASRVSYRLRILRAHGLIRKSPGRRRYNMTTKGRQIVTALLQTQHATLQQLNATASGEDPTKGPGMPSNLHTDKPA